jgi:Bacterial membrane protein YfhO
VAGPLLIVAGVLAVMRGYAFGGRIGTADILSVWMPTYCFLGKTLASGHVPAWNPYLMGGLPFAADPQSGWLSTPPMLLFTLFPCGGAIRWMVVLQPLIGGLGIFAFLRSEGLSRPLATVGGLVLGIGMAGSNVSSSLPFAGSLAWTAVALAACSRYVRAQRPSRRVVWCVATGLAWGQLAAAHFSTGTALGTGALVAFLAADAWRTRRAGVAWRSIAALAGGLVAVTGVVNLGFLVPRLAYLHSTSISLGYQRLSDLGAAIVGRKGHPSVGPANLPTWPLWLAAQPGAHLGAVALGLAFGGWWSAARRPLTAALSVFGLLLYVLSLRIVAVHVPAAIRLWRPVDLYLHDPQWFAFPMLLIVAVLGALGVEALIQARDRRTRGLILLPGLVVWGLLPVMFGIGVSRLFLLWGAGALTTAAILAGRRRPRLIMAIPVILLGELLINGIIEGASLPSGVVPGLLTGVGKPPAEAAAYLEPTPMTDLLRTSADRFVRTGVGVGGTRAPDVSRGLIPNHAAMFHIYGSFGYNPVQLIRYWVFIRAAQRETFRYNRAILVRPVPIALDLLDIRWVAGGERSPPLPDATPVLRQGPWTLWRRTDAPGRATLVPSWVVVHDDGAPFPNPALSAVLAPRFDPSREVVLDHDPRLPAGLAPPGPGPGSVRFVPDGTQAVTIDVHSSTAALVLVRTPFDEGWHATVDGRPAEILRADYFIQAVPVTAGPHVVRLAYDDPWIGYGLLGSALALVGLAAAYGVLIRRERSRSVSADVTPA